ncbi:MAG: GNAT family N-acetyltransferase [Acidithiobacillus sp.]|nr:GNAT family N-acetyltransferase [Acidithiobacillus sp.]
MPISPITAAVGELDVVTGWCSWPARDARGFGAPDVSASLARADRGPRLAPVPAAARRCARGIWPRRSPARPPSHCPRWAGGLFIHPDYMGHGIGRRMMAHLEGFVLSTEVTEIFLDSTLNAAPFYRKCGFNGESISTYPSLRGFTINCVRMTKSIGRSQC